MKAFIQNRLMELKEQSQFRELRNVSHRTDQWITVNGKKYLNLSSNDYLGLASDQELINEFYKYLNQNEYAGKYLFSGSSSRLLTGNDKAYDDLENKLAELYKKESALVFNSGYHANIGIIQALFNQDDMIVSDKLNHASIVDGIRLSGSDFYRYKHNDYEQLEKILKEKRANYKKALIITESLFSMDGDKADLKKLVELKEKYNAVLYVDEAHSCGVYGENGLGLAEEENLIPKIDIFVGTFGKALASLGAYAVMDQELKEFLINTMRSFIFTTALPPINLMWSLFLLKKLPEFKSHRNHLMNLSNQLRTTLRNKGLNVTGDSQIIPVIIGENEKTVKLAEKLRENGYLLFPVRPPTVPKGTSRIRISLMASINWEDIKNLQEIIQ